MEPHFKIIDTNLGEKNPGSLAGLLWLSHQYLTHSVSAVKAPEITLETLNFHRNTPFTLPNTSITSTLILHELQSASTTNSFEQTFPYCIVDHSSATADPQFFSKITVLRGYQTQIKRNIPAQQAKVLYSMDSMLKQVQFEFSLSTYKPAFIGEIDLTGDFGDLDNPSIVNCLNAYFSFSQETGCPVVLNCNPRSNPRCISSDSSTVQTCKAQQTKIDKLIALAKAKNCAQNLVIWNIRLFINQVYAQNSISLNLAGLQYLNKLIAWEKVCLGFDIHRYKHNPHQLSLLAGFLKANTDRCFISPGVLFKTDLLSYAGEGYLYPVSFQNQFDAVTLDKLTRLNLLEKLSWKKKAIVIKQIVKWQCVECKKDYEEGAEQFKKFGKIFCSTTCIRKHKF